MKNIFKALNVTSEKELDMFVETLNLEINDYINFMSMLNETLEPQTIRENVLSLTESLYNGSYEKIQKQISKKPFERKLKEETVYDHSWYEVKGQKYPKRTKKGVVCENKIDYTKDTMYWNPHIAKLKNIDFKSVSEEIINDIVEDLRKYGVSDDIVDTDYSAEFDITNIVKKYIPTLKNDISLVFTVYTQNGLRGFYDEETRTIVLNAITDEFVMRTKEYPVAILYAFVLQNRCKEEFEKHLIEAIAHDSIVYESEENDDEVLVDEPTDTEENPKSSADPEITQFINTTEKVVNNTTNPDILKGLVDSIEAKIAFAVDVEQSNELGALKQKAQSKMMSSKKIDQISESFDYDNYVPSFNVGDNVEFIWGDVKYTGRVIDVIDRGSYEYYNVISYVEENQRRETFTHVDPIDNEMKKLPEDDYDSEELDETCSAGATCAANVSGFAKPIGTTIKRNKKKVKESFDSKLFKESILNDFESASKINGKQLKYFFNEGKYYMSVDNALVKSFNKNVMIETVDMILNNEDVSDRLLEGYSCYEMNILMEDEDIYKKIGRIAGIYNVKTHELKFLSVGEMHKLSEIDFENGETRFGIQPIKGVIKCYISAIDKGYAYKAYKFMKHHYKETPIDVYELEIINDDGKSMFIKYDNVGNQIFENKNVEHCDSKTIKKIMESQNIEYDYKLYESIINRIMEDVTANPLNPNGIEQVDDEELNEPKTPEEIQFDDEIKQDIGSTNNEYAMQSPDDENELIKGQHLIGFDEDDDLAIVKGDDGKINIVDSRKLTKISESVLTEGIADVAKYFPKLDIESIKEVVRIDPTYTGGDQLGKYSKWILRLVSNNVKNIENQEKYRSLLKQYPDGINPKNGQPFQAPIKLPEVTNEDRYKITQSLKKYDIYKEEIGKPLDSFKTLPELDAAISDVEERGVPAEKLARQRLGIFKDAMKKGLKKVYEDGKWIVGIPETHESSKMFGDETSWCTTSNGSYYDNYSSQGPLFINLNKDNGRLYQFHFQSASFMDEHDSTQKWEDGGDLDGFFQENPFLEHFYKDYVRHEEDPNKIVDSIVSDRDRLNDIFDNVYNLHFDGNNITGTLDIEQIDPIYRNGNRDTVSLSFISKMLSGDWWEAFDYYDEGHDGLDYLDSEFESEIKKISKEGGIDLTKIKWSEIMDILRTDGSEATENFTEEEAEKLYYKMTNDFNGDDMSIGSVYSDCKINGAANEAYDSIRSDLIDNLPLNPKEPFNNSDLNIYIPFDDLVGMCTDNSTTRVDIESDTTWYDRLYVSLDFSNGWLYSWYSSKFTTDSFGIYEPSYGWDGFDDSQWRYAVSNFVHYIHTLKRGNNNENQ